MPLVLCPPMLGCVSDLEPHPAWAGSEIVRPELPAVDAEHQWVAHLCLALQGIPGSLTLVLHAEAARLAPRLGFAMRSARRPIVGYVLVDPELPPARSGFDGADWPDAPVTVVLRELPADGAVANQARLRGWQSVLEDQPKRPLT